MDSVAKVLDAIVRNDAFRARFQADRSGVVSELNLSQDDREALGKLDVDSLVRAANSVPDNLLKAADV